MALAIIIAFFLCFLNALTAVLIIQAAFRREFAKFNRIVFSSLVIRYFLMVGFAWAGIAVLGLNSKAFSLTLIISTFIMLMAEIVYIHFKSKSMNLQNIFSKQG